MSVNPNIHSNRSLKWSYLPVVLFIRGVWKLKLKPEDFSHPNCWLTQDEFKTAHHAELHIWKNMFISIECFILSRGNIFWGESAWVFSSLSSSYPVKIKTPTHFKPLILINVLLDESLWVTVGYKFGEGGNEKVKPTGPLRWKAATVTAATNS